MKKYVIVKNGEKFDVFESDDDQKPVGESLGQFDDEDAAQSKVRSLRSTGDGDSGSDDQSATDDKARDNDEGEAWDDADPKKKKKPRRRGSDEYDEEESAAERGDSMPLGKAIKFHPEGPMDWSIPGEAVKFSQAEVDYTMYAVRQAPVNAVCQTCRFFTDRRTREGAFIKHECVQVECYPLDIVPTGYCKRWTERPMDTMEPPLEVVVIGDISEDTEDEAVEQVGEMAATKSPPVENRTLGRFPSRDTLREIERRASTSMFKALGNRIWIAAHTNAYEDKQGEILPLIEHKRHVARVKAGIWPMPELWHWHLKGTRHGQALWYDMIGNMVVAVGLFDDNEVGRAAEKFYKSTRPGEITMSHGFFFDPTKKKGRVYGTYNTFEITTLWSGDEANPYTTFQAIKEMNDMKHVKPEQIASIKRIFGEDAATSIIESLEPIGEADKALEALGIARKDLFGADVTDDAIDEAVKDDQTDDGDLTAFIGEMVKQSGMTAKQVVRLINGVDVMAGRLERVEKTLELAPIDVKNSKTLDDGDGVDAEAIKEAERELKEKQKSQPPTDQWDSFLPGLT